MDEPGEQQAQHRERALPEWANHYEAPKRHDQESYQEYDDMDLWDDDEIVTPALPTSLPPVQDYLGMIQQTRRDIEQAQQKQKERQKQQELQRQQQQQQRPTAGPSGRGRGRGTGRATSGGAQRQGENRLRDPAAIPADLSEVNIIEKEKKPRKPIPKLDAERLLGEQGLPLLRKYGQTFKIRREYTNDREKRANAKDNLARMMAMCQTWGDNLFPKATFQDFIRMTESKCKTDARVKVTMDAWRDEYFEQERVKRDALELQQDREAQLAAAVPEADDMDLASIFPMAENGSSSVFPVEKSVVASAPSPMKPVAPRTPTKPVASRTPTKPVSTTSRPSEKSHAPIELDDSEDEGEIMAGDSASDEDTGSLLNRLRQQRAARLAGMRGDQGSSSTAASRTGEASKIGELVEDMATQPFSQDHEEALENMDANPDNLSGTSASLLQNDEQPEEATAVSSQRRRRRLIVEESDDED